MNKKLCCGYDIYPSTHVDCGRPLKDFNITSGRALRCPHCVIQQLEYSREAYRQKLAKPKAVQQNISKSPKVRTPNRICKVCLDLPHRRKGICKGCQRPESQFYEEPRILLSSHLGVCLQYEEK